MDGFINLLKPPGMTSSDAVVTLRRLLRGTEKVGHGGTLDPEASGVLPLCVGRAARLFDYIIDKPKTYIAELALGVTTDTQDQQGRVLSKTALTALPDARAVRDALPAFLGAIWQRPPAYSALKRDGKKLYELSRAGRQIDIEPRQVQIYEMAYMGESAPGAHMLRVTCGKGAYIRALCSDIGEVLGCGAHLSFLLRTRAGAFDVEHAVTCEQLIEAAESGALNRLLVPMDMPLAHLPAARVAAVHRARIINGGAIPPSMVEIVDTADAAKTDIGGEGPLRIYCGEDFAGIGELTGGALRMRAMLLSSSAKVGDSDATAER